MSAETKRQESREDKRFIVEVITLVFVCLVATFSLIQTWASVQSAKAAVESATTSRNSLEKVERAYLVAGEAEEMLGGWALVKIHISNSGHVPTDATSLLLNFERMTAGGIVLEDRVLDVKTKAAIDPGKDTYALVVGMPHIAEGASAAVSNRAQILVLKGHLAYGDGFGKSNTLELCYGYHAEQLKWLNCSGGTADIDLGNAKHRSEYEHPDN